MFYEFDQNNSGGWFEENDKLCAILFIEAETQQEAVLKAENLGCYWNGVSKGIDCECCGDRWHKPYSSKVFPMGQFDNIEEYAQYLSNEYGGWTTPDVRVFYEDGTGKEFYK